MDNNTSQYESQKDISFDAFGSTFHVPNASFPLIAVIAISSLVLNITNIFKSKPMEFAVDLLRGADLELLENLDDIAVELRELTAADRVLIIGFHNGKKNTVYHWKRLSVLAEAVRLGIEPVKYKIKDVDTYSIFSKSDYDYFLSLNGDRAYIHTHQDLPTISSKQKRFLYTCYMFGQYVLFLMDDEAKLPHGVIFIQYDSRDKCEVERGNEIGWSDNTCDLAYSKAQIVNSLIYDRAKSIKDKFVNFIKHKLRL